MVKNNNNKKGQNFSADILVVVVIVLFGSLFLVMNKINEEESKDLDVLAQEAKQESKIVFDALKEEEVVDLENNVDVKELLTLSEAELREKYNLRHDFAIVFEKDGKLVQIDAENDVNCIGSGNIIVNGANCK